MDFKAKLNQFYLEGKPARAEKLLQQLGGRGSGRRSESGDARSSDRDWSSEGRGAKPVQEEECPQCRLYGHRCAPAPSCACHV